MQTWFKTEKHIEVKVLESIRLFDLRQSGMLQSFIGTVTPESLAGGLVPVTPWMPISVSSHTRYIKVWYKRCSRPSPL